MKNIKILSAIFAIAVALSIGFVSCEKEAFTPDEPITTNNTVTVNDRTDCEGELDEISFDYSYDGIRQLIDDSGAEPEMSTDEMGALLTEAECFETTDEFSNFVAKTHALNASSAATLLSVGRSLSGVEVTPEIEEATLEALTQIEATFNEPPLLAMYNQENAELIGEITNAAFEGVITEEGVDDRDERCALTTYFACESKSFPSKKFHLFANKTASGISFMKRSEGGWFSQYICGFRVYNFSGNGNIKGNRPRINTWKSILLGAFHGGSYPYNNKEVFVYRIPVVIVYGWNTDCNTVKNGVKSAMKVRR